MKKALVLFCILIMLSSFVLLANAAAYDEEAESYISLTEQEISVLKEKLIVYGYGEAGFTFDVLYDPDNCPAFMLGITDAGYIILERDSLKFRECGGGNPYRDYMSDKKYYGGAICYFVQPSDANTGSTAASPQYYDILHGSYSSFVPRLDTKSDDTEQLNTRSSASTTSIIRTVKLPNSYNYIQRRAFGNNTDNTCSAVTTGIALNYIAAQHNIAIVPSGYISEPLDSGVPDRQNPASKLYPNANRLYRYIIDTCGMGPISYADCITVAVSQYAKKMVSSMYHYNLGMVCELSARENTIKYNINNKPVLITTTFWGDYKFHTMCVYGYRDTSDGCELLVHLGWYSENVLISGKKYYQQEVWINESDATYGYYFSFENLLSNFKDIPAYTDWSYPGIFYAVDKGIMSGTTSTTFSPYQPMTRAMLVSTLYRMAGSPSVTYTSTFSDVPKSAWYANCVIWASKNNIVAGVGNGKFDPNGNITREQLAVFLYRYAAYRGYDTSKRTILTRYSDHKSISSYARNAMAWAIYEGLISGSTENGVTVLAPKDPATRAQVAAVLMRFMERFGK